MACRRTLTSWLLVSVFACSNPPPAQTPATPPTEASPARGELAHVEASLSAKNYEQAKRQTDAVLARAPHHPQALYYAGVAAEGLGDKTEAETRYRQALQFAPRLTEATLNLSALLLEQRRAHDAVSLLRPAVETSPSDPSLHANLAAALSADGDAKGAAAEYEAAMAKGGGLSARLGLAETRASLKDHPGALRALREGLPEADKNREQLAALALAFARLGAFDEAISAIDRALLLQPGAELFTYRGLFQRSRKDLTAAAKDFQSANQQAPDFAPAYLYAGEVAEEQKKMDDAKRAYETAIRLAGGSDVGTRATERLERLRGKTKEKRP